MLRVLFDLEHKEGIAMGNSDTFEVPKTKSARAVAAPENAVLQRAFNNAAKALAVDYIPRSIFLSSFYPMD
jgi:hypothetical protein